MEAGCLAPVYGCCIWLRWESGEITWSYPTPERVSTIPLSSLVYACANQKVYPPSTQIQERAPSEEQC